MPNDPVPQYEQLAKHQAVKPEVTAYDLTRVQDSVAATVKRLQDQLNALEARIAALE